MTRSISFFAAILFACAGPSAAGGKAGKRERIKDIAAEYWELVLGHDPRLATRLGDHRFDGDLEWVGPNARDFYRSERLALVKRAAALAPASLSEAERLDRDVLVRTVTDDIAAEDACRYERWRLDHLDGLQAQLAELPISHVPDTAERAASLMARYAQVPRLVAEHIANLDAGLKGDEIAPELNARRVVEQIDGILGLEPSPFVPAATHAPSRARLEGLVHTHVVPALRDYRRFIVEKILPEARKTVAVGALPFGPACYAAEIVRHTGLRKSPAEVHAIGLSEVARIRLEMETLARKMRTQPPAKGAGKTASTSKGPLADVLKQLERDPKQRVTTRQALLANAEAIVARAREALPKAFRRLPRTPIELKPLEAYREKESPAAYYSRAADDGSRAATYYLNTHAPEARPLYDQEALAFHEAVPGHHLQIALAQELCCVPAFRRLEGHTAFVEGWALYAERLAKELGLYTSDASELGRLGAELWRAKRLVVDTGLHALGWSREQALAFMRDGSTHPDLEMENEIDRYITWPGQALAYKLGELEISSLRRQAERALGPAFDLGAFHEQLLGAGALPLDIVRKRIERWLEAATEPLPSESPAEKDANRKRQRSR